jgi:molybdenum-dependent DNA-binding transcriptional regulator ModE
MTASVGREVDANLLSGAAPGSAQARADAQDAGRQNLGDLVEALGGGHRGGVESLTHAGDEMLASRRLLEAR